MKKTNAMACIGIGLCACAAEAQVTHDVVVGTSGQFIYSPAHLTVSVGDTVRWTWVSSGHNVVSDAPGAFSSGPTAPTGTVFEVVFDQSLLSATPVANNRYSYRCDPHVHYGMVGDVTVLESCYADCDGSGVLDLFDFLCFQNSFVNSEPYACDCDITTGTNPPVCDIFDFLCFQNAFVVGCP